MATVTDPDTDTDAGVNARTVVVHRHFSDSEGGSCFFICLGISAIILSCGVVAYYIIPLLTPG